MHIDKKPSTINVTLNGTDQAVKGRAPYELNQNQDVPNEKIIRAETQKSNDKESSLPIKPESGSVYNSTTDANSSAPVTLAIEDEKQSSFIDYANEAETNDSGAKYSPHDDDLPSPNTINKAQVNPF